MQTQEDYVGYWRRRRSDQRMHNQRLAQQARADLERIVDLLVSEFGATQIILFGSLVKGRFADASDIDLAVEGIPSAQYFAALAAVNCVSPVWVDLKPLEDLTPHFRHHVLATGEQIYARDQ
ncbi:MAG: nucleotidyltransferase domain-containing protein [Candidatus Poribacteria bacterium]|nr:nucleotidyltransferase domain-containing protein [Candidatus Poribacteria bacterium]